MAKEISATSDTKGKLESDSRTITEIITKDEEDALIIEIGLIRKKRLIVRGTFMEYEKSKIYYDDVNTILYYDSGSKYVFRITSSRDRISLKLDKSVGVALLNRVASLIEPSLVSSLVKLIFENEVEVRVGKIRFNKTGYHSSRRLREDKSVLWNEEIYIPQLANGECVLYANKNGSSKHFASISLEVPNAIVIPELVKACHDEFHMRTQSEEQHTDPSEQTLERLKKDVARKQMQEGKKTDILSKGMEFYNKSMYDEAIEYFEKILKDEPDNYTALACKGLSFAHLGREIESMNCFDEIPESETAYHSVLNNKGMAPACIGKDGRGCNML